MRERVVDAPASKRGDGSPIRVLIVDDETVLAELISMALRYEGWETRTADSGSGALAAVEEFAPDAVVLDIMLPDLDGLSVLRRMREAGNEVPVLFLTARDTLQDRLTGLDNGGDDYVTKPFSLEEVVARMHALVRRSRSRPETSASEVLRVSDLHLDQNSYEVVRAGTRIELTTTEFELLRYLMQNANCVVSKMQIYDAVWSHEFDGKSNLVEIYISYLRKKIDAGRPPLIHTIRGVGYIVKPAHRA